MEESDTVACADCGGTGFVIREVDGAARARPCGCRGATRSVRTAAAKFIETASIPPRYHDCEFENFDNYDPQYLTVSGAKERAIRYVTEYPFNAGGLLFMGPPGVGKTHLAVAILRSLALEKGAKCYFCDVQELLGQLQARFDKPSERSQFDLLQPVLETEVVVLDDLGRQRATSWAEETMSHIVTTRYNHRRVTIVTTNFMDESINKGTSDPVLQKDRTSQKMPARLRVDDPVENWVTLKDRVGSKIFSRLMEMCNFVKIEAGDFRERVRAAETLDRSLARILGRPKGDA